MYYDAVYAYNGGGKKTRYLLSSVQFLWYHQGRENNRSRKAT